MDDKTPQELLREAAQRFRARGKTVNASTCEDIANKVERFGAFASEAQASYARRLIDWSEEAPRPTGCANGNGNGHAEFPLPTLHKLFAPGGLARLRWGDWLLNVGKDFTTTWIKYRSVIVARMTQAGGNVYRTRKGAGVDLTPLKYLDAHPVQLLREHGEASGRCAVCGRVLTDPESIRLSIGPICLGRVNGLLYGASEL